MDNIFELNNFDGDNDGMTELDNDTIDTDENDTQKQRRKKLQHFLERIQGHVDVFDINDIDQHLVAGVEIGDVNDNFDDVDDFDGLDILAAENMPKQLENMYKLRVAFDPKWIQSETNEYDLEKVMAIIKSKNTVITTSMEVYFDTLMTNDTKAPYTTTFKLLHMYNGLYKLSQEIKTSYYVRDALQTINEICTKHYAGLLVNCRYDLQNINVEELFCTLMEPFIYKKYYTYWSSRKNIDGLIMAYFETVNMYLRNAQEPHFNGGNMFHETIKKYTMWFFSHIHIFAEIFEREADKKVFSDTIEELVAIIGACNMYRPHTLNEYITSIVRIKPYTDNTNLKSGVVGTRCENYFQAQQTLEWFTKITTQFAEHGVPLTKEHFMLLSESFFGYSMLEMAIEQGRIPLVIRQDHSSDQVEQPFKQIEQNMYKLLRLAFTVPYQYHRYTHEIVSIIQTLADMGYSFNVKQLASFKKLEIGASDWKSIIHNSEYTPEEISKIAIRYKNYWVLTALIQHKLLQPSYELFMAAPIPWFRTELMKKNPKIVKQLTKRDFITVMLQNSKLNTEGAHGLKKRLLTKLCKVHNINRKTFKVNG